MMQIVYKVVCNHRDLAKLSSIWGHGVDKYITKWKEIIIVLLGRRLVVKVIGNAASLFVL